jgi:MFS family permease
MPKATVAQAISMIDIPKTLAVRAFRNYVIGIFIYLLPFLIAIPFYQVYYQESLKMNKTVIGTVLVGYQIVKLLSSKYAGRWVDRVGPRAALLIAGPMYATFFLLLSVAEVGRIWPLYVAWIIIAFGDAMWGIATQSALFGTVPKSGARPAFFAVANLVTLGLYGIGALCGEVLIRSIAGTRYEIAGISMGQYSILFLVSSILMIPCTAGAYLMSKSSRDEPS